jgi:hypothetical protein
MPLDAPALLFKHAHTPCVIQGRPIIKVTWCVHLLAHAQYVLVERIIPAKQISDSCPDTTITERVRRGLSEAVRSPQVE